MTNRFRRALRSVTRATRSAPAADSACHRATRRYGRSDDLVFFLYPFPTADRLDAADPCPTDRRPA